jgi:hypothetical protein
MTENSTSSDSQSINLEDLIKKAKDDFRQYVDDQPEIASDMSPEQLKDLMKIMSDKEAEFLSKAITKYIINVVNVEIVKLQNEISKLKRQIGNL